MQQQQVTYRMRISIKTCWHVFIYSDYIHNISNLIDKTSASPDSGTKNTAQ